MKGFLLSVLLLLSCVAVCRADEVAASTPELLGSLEGVTRPADRFAIYEQFIETYVSEPQKRLRCVELMLGEAQEHNDERHMTLAYLYYAYDEYNKQNLDNVRSWAEKLEVLATKNQYYDLLFKGQECIADLLLNNNHYEQAEQKAWQILNKAQQLNDTAGIIIGYRCLARIYTGTYRRQEAVKLFEKAYRLAERLDDTKNKLDILSYLIYISKLNNQGDEWIKYLHINEGVIMKLIRRDPSLAPHYKGELLLLYLSYLDYYTQTKNPAKAKQYKALVEEYYSDEYLLYQYDYGRTMISYYMYIQDWEKALEANALVLDISLRYLPRNYPLFLQNRASVLRQLGRNDEAFATLREALFVKDTMQLSIYKTQVAQIKGTYDTNQYMLHQASVRRSFQYAVLGVVVVIIVVMIILVRKSSRMRATLRRSEQELLRIAAEVDKASRIKEHFLSNISYAIQKPLNQVVDNSLLLTSDRRIDEVQRSAIADTILRTTERLMVLVEEILDLSRLESGRMKFAESDVDVQMQLLNLAGCVADGRLEWVSPFDITEPVWVSIDGKRLSQVFTHLLAYTEGDVRVELAMEDAQTLALTVTNPTLTTIGTSQEAIIRNEICRMIIQHFDGRYDVVGDTACLTLKVKAVQS